MVKEYEADELADHSEDEKKIARAEKKVWMSSQTAAGIRTDRMYHSM